MAMIEQRIEAASQEPNYAAVVLSEAGIASGSHRRMVGGEQYWDTHGLRQVRFLERQGLVPEHKVLDVGCGCLRAGRHLIDLLEPANYYGVDANLSLLQAGFDIELTDEQRARLPIDHLRANDRFDCDFGVQFDIALAQSVFTHVSLNYIRLCLYRVAKVMRPGGVFYATLYERDSDTPPDKIFNPEAKRPMYGERNVFWYYRRDLKWAAGGGPWSFRYIGEWGHPTHQKMVAFTRLTDEEIADREETAAAKRRAVAAKKQPRPEPSFRDVARLGRRWAARRIRSR